MGGIVGSNMSRSRRMMKTSRPFVGGKMDVFPRLWSNPDRFFKLAPYRGCILIVDDAGWPGIIVYTTEMIGRRRRSFCCRCHCWGVGSFVRRNSNKRFGKTKASSLETTTVCNGRRDRCIWTSIIIWIRISTQNYT